MKIGIIGQGFVGNAIYQKFSKYYDVKTYDIKGMIHCNSDERETMDNEIVFVCLPTPMNENHSCHRLSTPRAPKELFPKCLKIIWSRKWCISKEFATYFA